MSDGRGRHGNHATGASNGKWGGGKSSHPLYDVYNEMVARCNRPTHKRYASYGGRGIMVCESWLDDFWAFVRDMGPRPEGSRNGRSIWSLERIDNDGNYEPGNVAWGTYVQQANNKRGFGDFESRRNATTGRFA